VCSGSSDKLTGGHLIGDSLGNDETNFAQVEIYAHALRNKQAYTAPALAAVNLQDNQVGFGRNFTPDSLIMPVTEIKLEQDDMSYGGSLYDCKQNCEIDVMDAAALERAFSAAATMPAYVQPGTFSTLAINTCHQGSNNKWQLKVRGSVLIDGVSWVTQAGAEPLTTAVEKKDYVTYESMGCVVRYRFYDKVSIAAGQKARVNLLLSPENTQYAIAGKVLGLPPVCVFGELNTFCPGQPTATPYVGAVTPTVEKYYITDSLADVTGTTARGILLVMFDQAGHEFGGTTQPFVGSTGFTFFNYAFLATGLAWSENADGTYHAKAQSVDFPSFQRGAHTGTLKWLDNNQQWNTVEYRAIPAP
jgi:hypothetical protein